MLTFRTAFEILAEAHDLVNQLFRQSLLNDDDFLLRTISIPTQIMDSRDQPLRYMDNQALAPRDDPPNASASSSYPFSGTASPFR